jgi:energy-coupling factor transporter ATP-binding protein EcfA2
MIDIQNVSKSFGRKCAVDRLNLTVNAGEVFGFLGPNGAGKTTTIKMIVGLLRPSEGRILVCGHDVAARDVAAKATPSAVTILARGVVPVQRPVGAQVGGVDLQHLLVAGDGVVAVVEDGLVDLRRLREQLQALARVLDQHLPRLDQAAQVAGHAPRLVEDLAEGVVLDGPRANGLRLENPVRRRLLPLKRVFEQGLGRRHRFLPLIRPTYRTPARPRAARL